MASQNKIQIEDRMEGDVVVLIPMGDVDLETSPHLRDLLRKKVAAKTPKLAIDFSQVPYIDSSGLATVIEYKQGSVSYKGRIVLACMTPRVKGVFEIMRLDQIFTHFPELSLALASLQ